jgi:hypothetical protein
VYAIFVKARARSTLILIYCIPSFCRIQNNFFLCAVLCIWDQQTSLDDTTKGERAALDALDKVKNPDGTLNVDTTAFLAELVNVTKPFCMIHSEIFFLF